MIDFRELSPDGTDFELMMRDLLQRQGLEVYWSGKGPDGGKDLICIERIEGLFKPSTRRWVVQCKHKAHSNHSVGAEEIIDICGICKANNARGYMLACTTQPSSALITKFDLTEANGDISIAFWDGKKIEHELMKPQNWDIAEQYFPNSVRRSGWRISSLGPRFWHAMYQDNILYLSTRLSSNPDILISEVERLLIRLKEIALPDDWLLRLRAVYFDDKNWNYYVYLDILVPEKVGRVDTETFQHNIRNLESIDGTMYQFDVLLYYYWNHSDHFDMDHHDYYDSYLKVFETGCSRKVFSNPYTTVIENGDDAEFDTEEYVNGEFSKLLNVLCRLDCIGFINAHNARIELIDKFSDYFEWEEMIEAADYTIDNFFEATFRIECLNFSEFEKLIKLLPCSVENHVNLRKNYIVLPGEGVESKEDSIYTVGLGLLQVGIKNKRQYRRLLNRYFRDAREAIEKGIEDGELRVRDDFPYSCMVDGKRIH